MFIVYHVRAMITYICIKQEIPVINLSGVFNYPINYPGIK